MGLTDKHLAYGDDIPQTQAEKDYYWKINHQQPCYDCISRQAALELMGNYDLSMGEVVKAIHALPPVTPKEKTGHWVNAKVGKLFPSNDFKCSECGNILDFDGVNCGRGDANYCPNCGAKMEVSEK